jgi:hypothetical protein
MKKLVLLVVAVFLANLFPMYNNSLAEIGTFRLNAEAGNSMTRLSWDEVPDVAGYQVYRKVSDGEEFSVMTSNVLVGTVFLDMNAPNQTSLCYFVSAVNDNGEEIAQSNQVCVTPDEKYPTFSQACKLTLIFQVGSSYYHVNSVKKAMKSPVVIRENRTFLLFRHVIEEIDGTIKWDGSEKRVDIEYKKTKIQLWISKSKAKVNGKEVDIDPTNPRVSPFIHNGYTYVPLRFPVSSLGEGEVKWFGDTKQAVLLFPDRCTETIEGVLQRWSPGSNKGVLLGFNGEKYQIMLAPTENYPRPVIGDCLRLTGKNDDPDQPGYLVVETVDIIDCPQTQTGVWEGVVLSVDAKKPSFEMRTGKEKVLVIADTGLDNLNNLIRRLTVGTCARVSGTIDKNGTITAISIDRIRCIDQTDEYNCDGYWVSGYVMRIDCTNGMVTLKTLSGDIITSNIPSNISCTDVNPGQCFRACVTGNDQTVINLLFVFDCDSPVCKHKYIKGKVFGVDYETNVVKVVMGDLVIPLGIEGLGNIGLETDDCIEACAVRINGEFVALWIRKLPVEDCQYCKLAFRVKAVRMDCRNRIAYLEKLGDGQVFKATFETEEFCGMEPGKCYEVCISLEDDLAKLLSYKLIDCPTPCNGETAIGTITKLDCGGQIIVLLTADGEKTYRIGRELCGKLKIKDCVKVCIEVDDAGNITVVSAKSVDSGECPAEKPKECTGQTFKAKVISADCKNGKVTVYVIESPYGQGMTMELPVDDSFKSLCAKLVPGKCYKTCADTSNMFKPKLLWMEEIPCPPEKIECNKHVKGKIADMDCATNGRMLLVSGDSKIEMKIRDIAPCKDFKVGDCVDACIYEVPGAAPILVSLKRLDPAECEPKPECKTVIAKVVATDCANGIISLKTTEKSFRVVTKEKDFCKQIQAGMCIEACIDYSVEPYKLVSFKVLPPEKCPCECTEVIKIHVSSVWCSNRYIEGTEILTVEARSPRKLKIRFDKEEFCRIVRDNCYMVCISTDEKGEMTGVWFKEIQCPEGSDCNGRVVDATIESLNCDKGEISIKIDGRIITVKMDVEKCSTLKPGLCVRLCISRDEKGVYSAWLVKILRDENCARCNCEGDWVRGYVREVDEKSGIIIFVDESGKELKIINKDETVSVKPYDCLIACISYDPQNQIWIAKRVVFVEASECKSCDGEIRRAVVKRADCANGYFVVDTGDSSFVVRYQGLDCENIGPGDVIVFCGERDAALGAFIAKWIKVVERMKCNECKGRKLVGKIDKYQPNTLVEILTKTGIVKFFTDNRKFIEMISNGGCFEVCLVWDPDAKRFVLEGIKPLPPSVCENLKTCDGRLFKGVIVSDECRDGFIKVSIGNNVWNVNISKTDFDCKQKMAGKCVEICGTYPATTAEPTHIIANYVKILDGQECSSELEVLTGVARKVDQTNKTALLEKDRNFTKLATGDVSLKESYCYRVTGYFAPDGVFIVIHARELDSEECRWSCDGDTMVTHLLEYSNDGFARIISGGTAIRAKLSDMALEILQKWAPDYFPLCVKVCLKSQLATTAQPPVITALQVLPASECKPVCSGRYLRGTIETIDCKTNKITIIDTNGAKNTVIVTPAMCTNLKTGMCVKICLSMTGKLSDGSFEAAWIEEDASSCGQTCRKITARVYDVICEAGSVIIKCIGNDSRFTITVKDGDCKLYQNAKCIQFCVEVVDGNITGKLVGKVEVLPESSCGNIPEPCDGKLVWHAKVARLDCANGNAYLNHGGKTREIHISSSICKDLVIGKCYKFCLTYSNGVYSASVFTQSSDCELTCVEGKIVEYSSANRRVLILDARQNKWMIQLPNDYMFKVGTGMCIKACGLIENNMLMAEWVEETRCTQEKISFSGTVSSLDCRSRVAQVKTDEGKVYSVKLPANFDCNSLKQGSCVKVEGTIDDKGVVTAASVVIEQCQQSWDMYVFDINCGVDKPYMIARSGESFHTVHLPANFSCRTIAPGMCVKVYGLLKQSKTTIAVITYIEATSIIKMECPAGKQMTGLILKTECNSRYIEVEVDGYIKKAFYPKSFDCSSAKAGQCVTIIGTVHGSYIDCYQIGISRCPSISTWIEGPLVSTDCGNGKMTVKQDNRHYTVYIDNSSLCMRFKVGQCLYVLGTKMNSGSSNIVASSISGVSCTNRIHGKITSLDCRNEVFLLNVKGRTYKVSTAKLPKTCTTLKVGQCIAVNYSSINEREKIPIVTASSITIEPCQ